MILLIDNYDSFTYNLYQVIAEMYPQVKVVRNDQLSLADIESLQPKGIILSPGPGRPEDAGICLDVIRTFGSRIPILGVCLGHQAIGMAYGGNVVRSGEIRHGKESLIFHNRKKLFKGVPLPCRAGRYHSLLVQKETLPQGLMVDAETADGLIMAISHTTHPVYGVQFHPESILTLDGKTILKNFVGVCTC